MCISYLLVGFWYDRKAAARCLSEGICCQQVGDFGHQNFRLCWSTNSFGLVIGDRLQELVPLGPSPFCGFIWDSSFPRSCKVNNFPCTSGCRMRWKVNIDFGFNPLLPQWWHPRCYGADVSRFRRLPSVMSVIAWTGAFTAFLGATIAVTQNDNVKGWLFRFLS